MIRALGLALLLVAAGCEPKCIVIPGPPVESGLFQVKSMRSAPDSLDLTELPYADAEELEIEISEGRTKATIRYVRNGVSIEETYRIEVF